MNDYEFDEFDEKLSTDEKEQRREAKKFRLEESAIETDRESEDRERDRERGRGRGTE